MNTKILKYISFLLILLLSTPVYAADVISNGNFSSGTTGWTHTDIVGATTMSSDAAYGNPSPSLGDLTGLGKKTQFEWYDYQNISTTINSTDDVFLSLWWQKISLLSIAQDVTDIEVRIVKPSSAEVTIWSELTEPSAPGTPIFGTVSALNVSSFFDENGLYEIRLYATVQTGNNNNGQIQINWDNVILDAQPVVANDPPVVTDIPNQSVSEGSTFATINLDDFVSDLNHTDAEMTWTYSGNTELTVNIVSRVATITIPDINWNGAETITFRATDPGSLWDEDPATFTVTAQNDAPVVTDIPDQSILEGATFTTINLDNYVSDVDNSDAEMTWTYSGNIELTVNIVSRVATITIPDIEWSGAETITFRATDPSLDWDEDPALFTVTAQNDAPVVTDIPDQTILEGATFTTINLDNYVSDVDNSDVEMTWSYSGNTELTVDITSRVATITIPDINWSGAETITFRATDPSLDWDEDPVLFTVTAQNDAPVVTDIPDQTILEGATFTTINLDNYVSDVDNTDAEMTWTYTGNTELTVNIVSRVATITIPDINWSGAETITFRATDPSLDWDEDPATFTVTAQNDAPVVTDIPNQTIAEGNSFTTITLDDYVSDVDNTDAQMTWTYSGNTELIVDITNRIATITTPSPTWQGAEIITFRATDPSLDWDEDAATFTVTPQNDPPVVTDIPNQTILEGATFTTITLDDYVSDPDNTDAEMTWTYSGNTELTVDITSRIATITIPDINWNGAETITFRATDPGSLWDEDPAIFTVTAQNDAPTLTSGATAVSPASVNRVGTNTTTISTQFTDVDQPGVGAFTVTFKVKDISEAETVLVNALTNGNGGLSISDDGGGLYTASYTWDPGDAQTLGVYDLFFEVSDGSGNAVDAFANNQNELTVTEIVSNEIPTIVSGATGVSPVSIDRGGAATTTFSTSFTDADIPGVSTFFITFKAIASYNEMEYVVANNLQDGQSGMVITDDGGGDYTASISWNPPDDAILGTYDLSCEISDGTDLAFDVYANNADELTLTSGADNAPPIVPADAAYAAPSGVERIGANSTTIQATFSDADAPAVTAFTVTFKIKDSTETEIVLADNLAHGAGGVTITNQGGGVYTAAIDWDPGDAQTLGPYDIYFHVIEGIDTSFDAYQNNIDELEVYDAISNNAPTLTADVTAVIPVSITRNGSEYTTIRTAFSDPDNSGKGDFTVTIKVRDQSSTEYTIVDAATHGTQDLNIRHTGNGTYEASFLWDPPVGQATGTYDLYFYVEDKSGSSVIDNYTDNADELTITSDALLGDGRLLRRTHDNNNCGSAVTACHNLPEHNGQGCLDCHTAHGTKNIYMIRETITTPSSGDLPVIFKTLGIGDPYNDPDPTVGDPNSGVMADSTDDVYTGICEVCHVSPLGHHRNDGSQPGPNHNDAKDCTSCHPHDNAFAVSGGGESSGGDGCSCHSFASDMINSTTSYHHNLNSENADYTISSKTCLQCHVHHDIFRDDLNSGVGAQRSKNLRVDITTPVVQGSSSVMANYDYTGSGSGGICLSCHTSSQTKGFTPPDGSTSTVAIPKADFDGATAHNYAITSTFSTDASTFNGYCVKCHNDNLTKSKQNSTNKFSLHVSDFGRLLDTLGQSGLSTPLEEDQCFGCHSGSSGNDYYGVATMTSTSQNIQTAFSRTYAHPTETYSGRHSSDETASGLADGNRHAECNDCHNPHAAQKGTHDGSTNLVSGALKGTWGVEPTSWPSSFSYPDNGNVFVAPSGYDVVNPATKEYQICLKCHSNYTTLPSGNRNLAAEINPNYPSTHGITIANQNSYCNTSTMNEPWASSGSTYCSDCHRSSISTDPEGPHGSNEEHLLVASIISDDVVGTPLCYTCHLETVYWSDRNATSNSRYDQHPSSNGNHEQPPGCFSCHMWDYASGSGYGVTDQNDWTGPASATIYIHGQNKKWVYNDIDGTAGSQDLVDSFINGYLANLNFDPGTNQCYAETCKNHNPQTY